MVVQNPVIERPVPRPGPPNDEYDHTADATKSPDARSRRPDRWRPSGKRSLIAEPSPPGLDERLDPQPGAVSTRTEPAESPSGGPDRLDLDTLVALKCVPE